MTDALRVSLIIVSRHRPASLLLCLKAVSLLDHPRFEVIVVADPEAIRRVQETGLPVKSAVFDLANISAARNVGLAAAAGDVVAFLDDDAVPEPTWLARLTAPFADPSVGAAGGFVRGPDGISYQWRATLADTCGEWQPLAGDPATVALHPGRPGRAIRTEGTNCAFRRGMLLALGGFDPAYRFFLDETDLNMRLAAHGAVTAIVPGAEVIHAHAPSLRRTQDRAPTDLTDIGASTAVFLRRHAAPAQHEPALARLRRRERARLLDHMVAGRIEPRDVARLMAGLDAGIAEGRARRLDPLAPLTAAAAAFIPFPASNRPGLVIAGRSWQRRRLRAEAARQAGQGRIVTLLLISPTALFHRMRFRPEGFWEQTGGLFGRAGRETALFRLTSFSRRRSEQIQRISATRPVS